MKRGIYLIFTILAIFLLFGSMVIAAEEEQVAKNSEDEDKTTNNSEKISKLKDQVSSTKLGEIGNVTKERAEGILEEEVNIPDELKILYWIFNGVGSGAKSISWAELIVFIITTLIIFIFSLEILEFTSFETDWVKYIIAGGITVIFGILGVINKIIILLYNLIDNFWMIIGIIGGILLALFIGMKLLNPIKKQKKFSKAQELGTKAGAALRGLSKMGMAAKKAAKE